MIDREFTLKKNLKIPHGPPLSVTVNNCHDVMYSKQSSLLIGTGCVMSLGLPQFYHNEMGGGLKKKWTLTKLTLIFKFLISHPNNMKLQRLWQLKSFHCLYIHKFNRCLYIKLHVFMGLCHNHQQDRQHLHAPSHKHFINNLKYYSYLYHLNIHKQNNY